MLSIHFRNVPRIFEEIFVSTRTIQQIHHFSISAASDQNSHCQLSETTCLALPCRLILHMRFRLLFYLKLTRNFRILSSANVVYIYLRATPCLLTVSIVCTNRDSAWTHLLKHGIILARSPRTSTKGQPRTSSRSSKSGLKPVWPKIKLLSIYSGAFSTPMTSSIILENTGGRYRIVAWIRSKPST